MSLLIDQQKCIGCGLCTKDCLRGCLEVQNGHAVAVNNMCFYCGHCVAVCPTGAIAIPELQMERVEELNGVSMDPHQLQLFMSGRRSIRHYQKRPVEREKLEEILETGRMTPTASNLQNLRFVVIQDQLPEIRTQVVETLYQNADAVAKEKGNRLYKERFIKMREDLAWGKDMLFYDAPALVVVIEQGYSVVNGALAASRMELTAAALGLGICYNGFFVFATEKDPALREKLGCSRHDNIAAAFTVGYPDITFCRTAPRLPVRAKWM